MQAGRHEDEQQRRRIHAINDQEPISNRSAEPSLGRLL